jgi:hypothetical protein
MYYLEFGFVTVDQSCQTWDYDWALQVWSIHHQLTQRVQFSSPQRRATLPRNITDRYPLQRRVNELERLS